ncbi:hypothetical protein [Streptomyces triticiradicis]|uniref:TPM domain-containing protein n=1 Tax=Streptomyces triticiradicis TaxID=2651189 RepID=A0A7J5DMK4_9ACTN|nr:hypothetical protein [Streptomyces triticiradicis]KAB1989938.1 hypothetical protein F8144_06260 [Streptomyces triticiradicis]
MNGPRLLAVAPAALLAAAGASAALLAGASAAVALPVGAGIGLLVWAAQTVTDRLTGGSAAGPRRPPDPAGPAPARAGLPPDVGRWLERASAAADRLDRHQRDSTDSTLTEALATAVTFVRAAADELRARAEAVRIIDAATAGTDPEAVRGDQRRLEQEARSRQGALREAKEASARAAGERAASLERLAELREILMATLESTVLRLEAAAERGSLLLSLHAAGDIAASEPDLTLLEQELEAVQAGLDKLDDISRSLHGTGPAPPEER